jgi:hypothetical protein
MLLPRALQACAQDSPHFPPGAVESLERGAGRTAVPGTDAESGPRAPSLAPCLPGHFVSAQYESDCARFVSEAKRLARHRAAALERSSLGF